MGRRLTRTLSSRTLRVVLASVALWIGAAPPARAQSSPHSEPISIARPTGRITIDGELSEDAWQHATTKRWYEVNPGDNTEPAVKNVGYLTDNDRFSMRPLDQGVTHHV
jgi:hypothetical protein